jgi:predicted nuclease of predicted toxin-antitoxin system
MKFLVDAQLPYGLALFIRSKGFDALHTNDLPNREYTSDSEIRRIVTQDGRIVITKDADFTDSFIIGGIPEKLLIITTGNIRNRQLFALFTHNWDVIVELFRTCRFVEMNNHYLMGRQ